MKSKVIALLVAVSLMCSFSVFFASAESVSIGDVNEDGKITASDARTVLRASAKLEELTESQLKAADADFNEKVTAADARLILRISAKLEDIPEAPETEQTTAETTTVNSETTTGSSAETTTKKPAETTTKKPAETTTKKPAETTTAKPEPDTGVVTDKYPESIDAFFKGTYYLNGSIADGSSSVVVRMAVNKAGTEVDLPLDGSINVGLYSKGKKTYMKLTSGTKKYYIELTESIRDSLGIDFSELLGEIALVKDGDPGSPVLTKGTYEGKECDIYTFSQDDTSAVKFYAIGDDVVQLVATDVENNDVAVIHINELSSKIPSDMLTISGYKATSILMLPTLFPELTL